MNKAHPILIGVSAVLLLGGLAAAGVSFASYVGDAQRQSYKVGWYGDPNRVVLPGDPVRGYQLYSEELDCYVCHTLSGEDSVGPTFAGLGERLEGLQGYSVETYLAESIINPCNNLVPGYNCAMPQDYAEELTLTDLNDLIAFLMTQ
ncbi:MAG: cytochrome c [Chloroflexi bacterium]|nr:cytochrome c [Chloroflexota bacterium]